MPKVSGEAAEVARAEAQAVLAMVVDEGRRLKLADVVAAIDDGEVEGADADALAELLELGLSTGRVRAVYGPEGEQAALGLVPAAAFGQGTGRDDARAERGADARSRGGRSRRSRSPWSVPVSTV